MVVVTLGLKTVLIVEDSEKSDSSNSDRSDSINSDRCFVSLLQKETDLQTIFSFCLDVWNTVLLH